MSTYSHVVDEYASNSNFLVDVGTAIDDGDAFEEHSSRLETTSADNKEEGPVSIILSNETENMVLEEATTTTTCDDRNSM